MSRAIENRLEKEYELVKATLNKAMKKATAKEKENLKKVWNLYYDLWINEIESY